MGILLKKQRLIRQREIIPTGSIVCINIGVASFILLDIYIYINDHSNLSL